MDEGVHIRATRPRGGDGTVAFKPAAQDWKQQIELCRRAQAGDQAALAELCESQRALIGKIVADFLRRLSGHYEADDMMQEGYLAVMESARYFKPDRGWRFSTYAGQAIRNRLARWIEERKIRPISDQEPDDLLDNAISIAPDRVPYEERLEVVADKIGRMCRAAGLTDEEQAAVELRYGIRTDGEVPNGNAKLVRSGMKKLIRAFGLVDELEPAAACDRLAWRLDRQLSLAILVIQQAGDCANRTVKAAA